MEALKHTSGLPRLVHVPLDSLVLEGTLRVPEDPKGVVLFAHGTGSGRHSPRNNHVADVFAEMGLASLLIDLLTDAEDQLDHDTAHLRFDIDLLAPRLIGAAEWLGHRPDTAELHLGYFGASTGAGAALAAAAWRPDLVHAVVSRGGRPDLASAADLARVKAPTLLIVGGEDSPVLALNQRVTGILKTKWRLSVIPHATHLFEEQGALDEVARLAAEWFLHYSVDYSIPPGPRVEEGPRASS